MICSSPCRRTGAGSAPKYAVRRCRRVHALIDRREQISGRMPHAALGSCRSAIELRPQDFDLIHFFKFGRSSIPAKSLPTLPHSEPRGHRYRPHQCHAASQRVVCPKMSFRYSSSSTGTVNLSRSGCGPGHGSFVSAKCAGVISHTIHFEPSKGQRCPPAR